MFNINNQETGSSIHSRDLVHINYVCSCLVLLIWWLNIGGNTTPANLQPQLFNPFRKNNIFLTSIYF